MNVKMTSLLAVVFLCGTHAFSMEESGTRIFAADMTGKTPITEQWVSKANLKIENGELNLKSTIGIPKIELPEEYRIRFSGKIKDEDKQIKGGFLTIGIDGKITLLVRLGLRGPTQILHPNPEDPKRNIGAGRKTDIEIDKEFQGEVLREKNKDGKYKYTFILNGTSIGSVVETPLKTQLQFTSWRVSPVLTKLEIFDLKR